MGFEPIKRILPKSIQQAGIKEQVTAFRVVEVGKEALLRLWGEDKAKFVEVLSFSDGCLKMATSAPSAMQELKMWEKKILNEINRSLGSKAVASLRFVNRSF